MMNGSILLIALLAINLVTFFVYGIDKWKAKHGKWRISEAALLGLAVIGGSVGAWLGMMIWRHKTMHRKFKYGIPLIFIAQIALLALASCGTQKENATVTFEHGTVQEHSPNVFLILYDPSIGKEPIMKAIKNYPCEIVYDYSSFNGMALKKPEDKTLEETMQYFKTVTGVTAVEYDHIIRLTDPIQPRLELK